ncbi:hypothetical protein FRC0201_00298 [Corynebacterium diphtheriae]|nr:hypothetical protein FRC0026_01310 [Corynebacterium diphtheriae]CAB0786605.1 hypothetical protein FRC0205_00274 [Corynebacterium diphtheriae]CAB0787025.1 hypothetical protein FRC0201_00298 [Corynebacterium diphtheriae]CAB0788437.1 hypothetical protein FRC0206_00427 [Corynebacterium diphtheriae]CAB0983494.1 hypothetical protein FRC0507_00344 [Corynebacterium diphtheriae]
MSEKQLTVAELLARSGKAEATSETPRRRRRNLEEGGVSVAELTGNIPKVKAKPAEPKHSNEPIDTPSTEETIVLSVVDEDDPVRLTTDSFPAVQTEVPAAELEEEPEEVAEEEVDDEEEFWEDDEPVSVASVVGLALVGIIVGVGIFLGFGYLWDNYSRKVVGLLALAVIAAMITVAHVLRTESDRRSMMLAGCAGVAVTFVPMLVS